MIHLNWDVLSLVLACIGLVAIIIYFVLEFNLD